MNYPKNTKIYALIDCNNFYVSCERVFIPKLRHKPVIVMSNNDGCVIARSNEVKELGIKMGMPVYQIKELVEKHNIQLFSSNYTLYADMSRRVMQTLKEASPNLEIYSIDECFLDLTNQHITDYEEFAKDIKEKVRKFTGMPVSVGIAHTKTLAKVANHIAKKHKEFEGVLSLVNVSEEEIDLALELTPVDDLWGVGRQYSKWLIEKGITTGKQMKYSNPKYIRNKMTIQGERLVLELNGISCIPLEEMIDPKKGIASTRAFGRYIETFSEISESVAMHVDIACQKLRKQESLASVVEVYIRTNPFNEKHLQYTNAAVMKLVYPSSDTRYMTKACLKALKMIYRTGYKYQKAGVIFTGIIPEDCKNFDMFGGNDYQSDKRDKKLMETVDNINKKWGTKTLYLARQGVNQTWGMKRLRMSNRWTTRWEEILSIK